MNPKNNELPFKCVMGFYMEPPKEDLEDFEIKPSNYFIESFNDEFKIYRVLTLEEFEEYPDDEVEFSSGGDFIIYIATCDSKDDAESAVHSYWEAVRKLNTLK